MQNPIKEVFLIYRDGRLIRHMTNEFDPTRDSYVIGPMLTAINSFVKDSFGKGLQEIIFEGKKISLQVGSKVWVAVVAEPSTNSLTIAKDMERKVEYHYHQQLANWDGDKNAFPGLDKVLNSAFSANYVPMFLPISEA